jgi:hypothetical protein
MMTILAIEKTTVAALSAKNSSASVTTLRVSVPSMMYFSQ